MGTFSLINALFLTKLLILLLLSGVFGASFYGDSYVHLKTSEISSKTSLHVRFKTSCPSGILFLSVGEKDFLFLELHSGRLQMRLDLGSGERCLRSEKGVHLNDLIWHSVELQHYLHNVTMTVDHNSHTTLRMPGPDLDLGVQGGLYVGGLADMDGALVPGSHPGYNSTGFRGCVDEVVFNQHNLLSSLRSYSGYKSVHEVSLGCSPQFSATSDQPISFFSSRAFLSLPPWDVAQEGGFECEIHTPAGAGDGLVLYSSVQHGGFVALEVWEGSLVLLVGTGGNRTEIRSLTHVNDEVWHPVSLRLLAHSLQLRVGEEEVSTSLVPPHPKAFQFSGPLYLGGVSDQKRPEVRSAGLLLVDGRRLRGGASFKGCLRNIRVNSQVTGFPHAMITKDVFVGCQPEKIPEAFTTPMPSDLLVSVSPPSDRDSGGDRRKNSPSFLLLKDLVVAEGGMAVLEAKNIKVNLDLDKLGLRQSQIRFRVEEQPVHGQLKLDLSSESDWQRGEEEEGRVFSMLDLWNDRVMYVHSGSEDAQDFFMFSVFTTSKKQLPSYLKGNRLHRFNITVTPVNDAPELSLPEGHLFTLLELSRRDLTTDVLWVSDPDTNSSQLIFTQLGSSDAGHLEHQDVPGTPITSFTLPDLEDGKISYLHTGTNTSRLAVRVTDGEKVSNTVILRVQAQPLDHRVVNNTGLEVEQGRAAVLSSTHLAVLVNVARQPVEVRFDVLEGPHYGQLQRLHSSGEWKATSYFYQKLLEKERIRYLNTFRGLQTRNVTDWFRCKVTINAVVKDEVLFPITVHWIHYRVTHSKMEVRGVQKVVITAQDLCVVSKEVKLSESELFFRIVSLPKKGNLVMNHKALKKNWTFSQKDVSDHQVRYELSSRLQDMKDSFTFQVFSRHGPHTGSHEFRITIRANQSHSMELLNLGLSVMEGESKLITRDRLFIHTSSSKTVLYTITRSPKHGRIRKINLSNSSSINDNIGFFTNQDIADERIMYVHDDSETEEDSFMFIVAMSKFKHSATKEDPNTLQEMFNISIQLVNDQEPVRVVDKVFHVVREGQRLLTVEDLYFHDPDTDFDDGQLVYTRRGIPLGELVLVNNTSHKLYQFTQADLEERRVLFRHRGGSSGRFVLFVSDGKHYVSSLLEVLAQDPYLHIQNNTGVQVQQGHAVTLFPSNLSVVTNMDVRDEQEVIYKIFLPPKHGSIVLNSQGADRVGQFTQADLKAGRVVYHHDNSSGLVDGFNVTVAVGEVLVDVGVGVKVYLESHQRPPTVRHHEQLVVEEGGRVELSKEQLEVVHEDSPPSEILFTVKMAPAHGFLCRSANGGQEEKSYQGSEAQPVLNFSQEDVNLGLLQYVQTQPAHTNDSFLLHATNGVTELTNIQVNIDIIPYFLPLQVTNITLEEGACHALTSAIIKVTNKHFAGLNFLYQVTEPPQHGHIEHSSFHNVSIQYFSHREVEREDIFYIHDGSDTLRDAFTLVANSSDLRKHSLPCTMFVRITPVNNQPPVVTANRILRVWGGSVTEMTVDHLSAEDRDSEPESLEFIVTPPSNGHLALKSAPSRHILTFTQAHILKGQLVFVHSGASSGGFHFQVNDGVNFAPREIFSTVARTLVLTMLRNHALQVFPGSVTTISQKDLLVVTNANGEMRGNHSVVFRVTSPPKLGRLLRNMGNTTMEVNTFTQSMINKGVISYHQTHPEAVGWTSSDSFTFSVSSPPAFLHPTIFHIHISYDHSPPRNSTALLANTGVMVTEGGRVVIDSSKLDASNLLWELPESQRSSQQVWYHLTSLPQHGVIAAGGQNVTGDHAGFSQLLLDQSGISYIHDASGSGWDDFSFEVWIHPEGQIQPQHPLGERRVVAERFNITVTSVSNHQPMLKTGPDSLSVAMGDMVKITSAHLQVEAPDRPPEDILYSVISQPSSGYLALGHKDSLGPPVVSFSQADVNQGRLHFVQQGEPSTGVISFNISTGQHRPLYKQIILEVITVSLLNNTGLELLQGQTSVVLSREQLAAQTNTRSNASIVYTVSTAPRHGKLRMNHKEVLVFSQEDIHTGQISYHMTDFTASNDSFQITVSALTSDFNLTLVNQEVTVMVRPLIYLREPVLVPSGIMFKLRKDTVDATELATLSSSNPLFHILSQPKHAKLVKLPFDHHGVGSRPPAAEFTFRDVEQGRVAIVEFLSNSTPIHHHHRHHHGNKTAMGVTALQDSFVFLLTAEGVLPAVGELRFTIVSYHQTSPPHVHHTQHPGHRRAMVHPHTPTQKNHTTLHRWGNQTHHRHRHRWGNQTTHTMEATSTAPQDPTAKHGETPHLRTPPIKVESLPRPASDPLLIILPFLACLLLIVILVVLILVFRHRREKRALSGLIQELAVPTSAQDGSPYLGRPERSVAVPSVVVTPLVPSGPNSPVLPRGYSGCLAPGALVWGPVEPRSPLQTRRSPTPSSNPTLRDNQYWV